MIFYSPSQYLPRVLEAFESVKTMVIGLIPDADIEHIGSSSITGALSKGDLDVLLRVKKPEFYETIKKLESIGFSIKEDTLRTESLCMMESKSFDIDVAIQLIEKGSTFENFIKFRDLLSTNPRLVERYNELKKSSQGLKAESYRKKKSLFIREVLSLE